MCANMRAGAYVDMCVDMRADMGVVQEFDNPSLEKFEGKDIAASGNLFQCQCQNATQQVGEFNLWTESPGAMCRPASGMRRAPSESILVMAY